MNKRNVFLDLDNTIIFGDVANEKSINLAKQYDYDFFHKYVICARPYLQEFLDFLFENFNVSIWTAASGPYGKFIYERFIKYYNPNRNLKLFLYDEHCKISLNSTGYRKSLSLLWDLWKLPEYNQENTILIDDLNEAYQAQPNNCILIKPFYSDMFDDIELMNVMYNLIQIK